MKKLTALFILLCITASLFALEEVRGIQTRVAKYPATDEALSRGHCGGYLDVDDLSSFAGFELTNENRYPVWVEMELYRKQHEEEGKNAFGSTKTVVPEAVVETKSITLKAGERYLWKVNIVAECLHRSTGETRTTNNIQDYFIKYKAYKAQ